METKEGSSAPYLAIVKELQVAIDRGDFAPGTYLPSARELARRHNVARATADRVLAEVQRLGLAMSQPQVGLYVRLPAKVARVVPTRDVAEAGSPVLGVADVKQAVQAPSSVVELLGVKSGQKVVQLDQTYLQGGTVVQVARSFMSASAYRQGRVFLAVAAGDAGVEETIQLWPFPGARDLALPSPGRPSYFLQRQLVDGGACVEVSFLALDAEVYVLVARS